MYVSVLYIRTIQHEDDGAAVLRSVRLHIIEPGPQLRRKLVFALHVSYFAHHLRI